MLTVQVHSEITFKMTSDLVFSRHVGQVVVVYKTYWNFTLGLRNKPIVQFTASMLSLHSNI